jgi:small-conductance mechanosensitive channel
VEFTFSVPVEQDLNKITTVTKETLDKLDFLTESKPAQVFFTEIADKSVKLVIWFWVPFHKKPSFMESRHMALLSLIDSYKQQGMIAVPQS